MKKSKSMMLGLLTTVLALSIALTIPNQVQSGYAAQNIKIVNATNFSCSNEQCANIISQFSTGKSEGLDALGGISADQLFDEGSLENLIGQLPLDKEKFSQVGELIKSLLPAGSN